MVAIVAGQGLGLLNTSLGLLGSGGQLGVAGQGRSGEGVYVNASTGNLVVQQQDEWLVGVGPDAGIVRTYNSLGGGADDNGDNWRLGVSRRVRMYSGTVGAAGSKAVRVGEDGSEVIYDWDATRGLYVSKSGGGSFDMLSNSAGVWTWVDGDTGTKETYEAVGTGDARLARVEDRDGNQLRLSYASTTSYLVTQLATWTASTATGETVTIAYDPSNPSDILSITTHYLKNGQPQTDVKRVSYTYETYGSGQRRLKSVTVDLTPQDQADNATLGTTYTTTYTYTDASSKRLLRIDQSDGSKLEFGYTSDGTYRINLLKETVSGQVRQTTLDYSVAGSTKVTDALGQVTELVYETAAGQNAGQLRQINLPAVSGVVNSVAYQYDGDGNVSQVTDARGQVTTYRYDANGNRVYERNALGNVVERVYSATNLLLQETRYTVNDPDGLGTGVMPGGALTQRYVYDAKGHLRFAISPSGAVTEYRYNSAGQRTSELAYPAGSLDATTLTTVLADFTSGSGALGTLPAAFTIVNGQLQLTSTNQASPVWAGASTASQPLGTTWKVEFTTAANADPKQALQLGVQTGTFSGADYRRHFLVVSAGHFYTDVYAGASAQPQRDLGTVKRNTTYVLEIVTAADGSTTMYVYEKGLERASGYSDSRTYASGWGASTATFSIQSYSGPLAATEGTSGSTVTLRVDNLTVDKALESALTTWTADKLSTAQRTDYTYDTRGQIDSVRTYASVDASGNGVTDATQSVTQYVYDQAGNLLQKIDARGLELATLNTPWAQAIRPTLGSGYPADAANLSDTQRAELRAYFSQVYAYDGLNRVISTKDPANGSLTLTSYADSALQTVVTLSNGLVVTSTYDQSGRLVSVARSDGTPLGTTSYTYDALGRLTAVSQPTGEKTYYLYDAASRKVGQIDGEGALTEYVYDANGQVVRTVGYSAKVSATMLATVASGAAGLPPSLVASNGMAAWMYLASGSTSGLSNGTSYGVEGDGTPLGEQMRWIEQAAGSTASEASLRSAMIPVVSGKRYEVSLYAMVSNATASLTVEYYSANGVLLATSSLLDVAGGGQPTKRLQNFVNIPGNPAGITQIKLVATKSVSSSTSQSSRMSIMRPLVALATATQTQISAIDLRPPLSSTDRYQWNVYDAAGRLSKTITSASDWAVSAMYGSVTEYRYDGAGRLSDTIEYATRLSGAQMDTVMASGSALSSGGDGVIVAGGTNIVLSVDGLHDRRVHNFYDADGHKTGQLDAANYYTEYQYDKAGRLVRTSRYATAMVGTLTDGNTPPTLLSSAPTTTPSGPYVVRQTLALTTGADQHTYYIYNARGQLKAQIDAEMYATAYEYDVAGNKTKETRYANKVVTTSSGAVLLGTTSTGTTRYVVASSGDHSTSYEYDAGNRIQRTVSQPTGLETAYTYDAQTGLLIKTIAAVGQPEARITQKRYDKLGRVTAELGGEGAQVLAGLGTGATNSQIENVWNLYATRHEYDQSGHRVATITPDGVDGPGLRTVFYYDQAGRVTHSINALGEVLAYTYTSFGEVASQRRYTKRLSSLSGVTGGLKSAMSTALSTALSQLADNAVDARIINTYNRAGQLNSSQDELSALSSYLYNAFGELELAHKPNISDVLTTQYMRGQRGEVVGVVQSGLTGLLSTTMTAYDAFGRAYMSMDANGNITERSHDKLGREVYVSEPGMEILGTMVSYDAFGRVIRRYDQQNNQTIYTYDDTQRTLTIQTPAGISMVTRFDRLGQTVEVSDGRGNLTRYTYNKDGQVTENAVYAAGSSYWVLGTKTTTVYDKAGRAYLSTDGRGSVTRTTYDAANRVLTQVRDDNGLKLTSEYRYDGRGNAVWSRDANGVWTRTEYDRQGNVTAVTIDPTQVPDATAGTGATGSNTFATVNNTSATVLNQRTEFVYNGDGSLYRVIRGAGSVRPEVTQYDYDEMGRRIGETLDPDGTPRTSSYEYDANGNVVARADALNQVTRYVYNASNLVTYVIDATGAVVKTDYDALGNVSRTIAYAQRISLSGLGTKVTGAQIAALVPAAPGASDQVTYNVYDLDGRLRLSMDALGYVTKRLYDASGNVARVIRYADKSARIDTAGLAVDDRIKFVDISGVSDDAQESYPADARIEQYVYDGANRLSWKIDALGYATYTGYVLSALIGVEVRYANPVVYPGTQRVLAINTAPTTVAAVPSPVTGAYLLQDSARDLSTWRFYDALGRVSILRDPAQLSTSYTYDAAGRVKTAMRYATASSAETDPANAKTTYDYDAAGNLVKVTDAENVVTTHTYDKAGRLTDTTVAKGTQDEVTTHYVLDAAGRITEEVRAYDPAKPEQAVRTRYVLDALGQRISIIDPRGIELAEGTSTWAQNERQRLIGTPNAPSATSSDPAIVDQYKLLLAQYTTKQEFDKVGHLTKSTDALGGITLTEYDAFGNTVKVTAPNNSVGYFYFDKNNQATWHVDPLNHATRTEYDAFGSVTTVTRFVAEVRNTQLLGAGVAPVLDPANVATAGLYIQSTSGKDAVTSIERDQLGRQTKTTDAESNFESITYDSFGNKTSFTNRLGGVYTYTYDKLGNMLTETLPVTVKQYNADGSLKSQLVNGVTTTDWLVVNQYTYDSRGNRLTSKEARGLDEERNTSFKYDLLDRQIEQRATLANYAIATDSGITTGSQAAIETRSYDKRGNLIEIVAADGGRTLTYWDALNRKTAALQSIAINATSQKQQGVFITYDYNKGGDVVTQRAFGVLKDLPDTAGGSRPLDPVTTDVHETKYVYDANHQLLSATTPSISIGEVSETTGNYEVRTQDLVSRRVYDANGNLIKETDARGNVIWHYYDAMGNQTLQVDAGRYVTSWTYDEAGQVKTETRYALQLPTGQAVGANSDIAALRSLVDSTDKRVTTFERDRLGRIKAQTLSNVEAYTVNATNGTLTRDSTNSVTRFEYNGLGQVSRKTEATGEVLDWTFDAIGREIKKEGAKFRSTDSDTQDVRQTTETEYNGLNLVRGVTQKAFSSADDRITRYYYDANGLVDREETKLNATEWAVTRYQYDKSGRASTKRISRKNADGTYVTDITTFAYDLNGQQTRQVVYTLNGSNQSLTSGTAYTAVQTQETRYDAYGQITGKRTYGALSTKPADTQWQQSGTYDNAGRLSTGSFDDGIQKSFRYDANGNKTLVIEGAGSDVKATAYTFSKRNESLSSIELDVTPAWISNIDPQSKSVAQSGAALVAAGNAGGTSSQLIDTGVDTTYGGSKSNLEMGWSIINNGYYQSGPNRGTSIKSADISIKMPSDFQELGLGGYYISSTMTHWRGVYQDDVMVPDRSRVGASATFESYGFYSNGAVNVRVPDVGGAINYSWAVQYIDGNPVMSQIMEVKIDVYKIVGDRRVYVGSAVTTCQFLVDNWYWEIRNYQFTPYPDGGGGWVDIGVKNASTVSSDQRQVHVKGLPVSTSGVLLYYRPVAGGAWSSVAMTSFGLPGWFSTTALNASLSSTYEYYYIAYDYSGVVASESGTLNSTSSRINVTPGETYTAAQTKAMMMSDGRLQITGLTSAKQSVTLKWRKKGDAAWQDYAVTDSIVYLSGNSNYGWSAAPISGTAAFTPASVGMLAGTDYEYILDVKDGSNKTLQKWTGSFKAGDATSVSPLTDYSRLSTTIHFKNLPSSAANVRVLYRATGASGAWTPQSLNLVSPGAFDWDTFGQGIVLNAATTYPLDYELQVFDSNGLLLQAFSGKVKVGATNEVVPNTATTLTPASRYVTIKSVSAATPNSIKVYYRKAGSGAGYTSSASVALGASGLNGGDLFTFDAAALLPTAESNGEWEYYYEAFDNLGNKLTTSATKSLSLSTTAGSAPQAVLLEVANPVQISRTSQKVNAFGEIYEQTDGRGNTTTLRYNAMGKLIEKIDAATYVTDEHGVTSAQKVATSTKYFYDLQGRQVGVEDANQHRNTQLLLAAGEGQALVLKEFHADLGIKRNSYNQLGDLRYVRNELSTSDTDNTYRTTYDYDNAGRLIKVTRPTRTGDSVAGYDAYGYDEAGNRIRHETRERVDSSNVYADTTRYDALGRVTRTDSAASRWITYDYSYDKDIKGAGGATVGGWKLLTTNKNDSYNTLVDYTDIFGRQARHVDLSGREFSYTYNGAGWLTQQMGVNNNQNIVYAYYADGRVKSLTDMSLGTYTVYEYDKAGNRIYEGYAVRDGVYWNYYQQATISYDELNRVTKIVDPQYSVYYTYDAVGNRRSVTGYKGDTGALLQKYWYTYDEMNRFTVTMGVLDGTTIKQGASGDGVYIHYNKAGQRDYVIVARDNHREDYNYTNDGYLYDSFSGSSLTSVGTRISRRSSDLMGRVLDYTEYQADGATPKAATSKHYNYDGDGKVLSDTSDGATTIYAMFKDGTLKQTTTTKGTYSNTTYYAYEWWDDAKQKAITTQEYNPAIQKDQNKWKPGTSYFEYDMNGHVKSVEDVVGKRVLRYATNAQGLILVRNEVTNDTINKKQNFFYFNGNRVGEIGNDAAARNVDYAQALAQAPVDRKTAYQNWRPITTADFDQNYQPINPTYPGFSAAGYTAQGGESLPQVAQTVWGDASMWYLLADANGLTSTTPLEAGQVLVIPNKVTNIHNNSTTTKPYDASKALGDTSPTVPDAPPPPRAKGCGLLGTVIMVIVAVVVTAYLGPLGGGLLGYALGAAAGSVASQAVGMAIGAVDKFSWSSVAMAAVGGAVTAGLGGVSFGIDSPLGAAIVRSMVGNAVTQGVGVVTGLQKKFDWRGVAAAGAGAAVSYGVGEAIKTSGIKFDSTPLNDLFKGTLTNIATGAVRSAIFQQRPNWSAIAAEGFGSALGQAVGDDMFRRSLLREGPPAPIVDRSFRNSSAPTAADIDSGASSYPVISPGGISAQDLPPLSAGAAESNGLRTVTIGRGQGPLGAMAAMGFSSEQQRAMYGQLAQTGQLSFDAKGMPIVQPGQELYVDLDDMSGARLGGRLISSESSNRAAIAAAEQRAYWDALQTGAWSGRTGVGGPIWHVSPDPVFALGNGIVETPYSDAMGAVYGPYTDVQSAAPSTMGYGEQMGHVGQVGIGFMQALPNVPSALFNGTADLTKLSFEGYVGLLSLAGVVSNDSYQGFSNTSAWHLPLVIDPANRDQALGQMFGDVTWGAVAPGGVAKVFGYGADLVSAARMSARAADGWAIGQAERAAMLAGPDIEGAGVTTAWGSAGYTRNTSRLVLDQRVVSNIGEVACGPTSCAMILGDNGLPFNIVDIANDANIGIKGTNVFDLARALQNNGLSAARWQNGLTMDNIAEATANGNAAIVQVNASSVNVSGGGSHFVVVDGLTSRPGLANGPLVAVRDPWKGTQYFSPVDEFAAQMTKGNWGILTNPIKY